MPRRHYIAQVADYGELLGFAPVIVELAPGATWSATDGRGDATVPAGTMIVDADVTDGEHAAVIADPRISYLPLDRGTINTPAGLDETVASLSAGRKSTLSSVLESFSIPLHDRDSMTIRQLLRRVKKRMLVRQYLAADDWGESLDSTWGDLNAAKRDRIRDRLRAIGVDMTVINSPDTLREAIRKILDQDVPALRIRD